MSAATQPTDALLRRAARWLAELAEVPHGIEKPTREQIHATQEWRDAQELYAIIRARKKMRAPKEPKP